MEACSEQLHPGHVTLSQGHVISSRLRQKCKVDVNRGSLRDVVEVTSRTEGEGTETPIV